MTAEHDLTATATSGSVLAVHRSSTHTFRKATQEVIHLVAGMGVADDAHFGARVKHRSRVRANPGQPNLRQVHLIQAELLDQVATAGYRVAPGELGENITTQGIDLLALPVGASLRLGPEALVVVTGLRNPCGQINGVADGLLDEVRERTRSGEIIRKAGVMAVVVQPGDVSPGDDIQVALPPEPRRPLDVV